ncbi:MAG TPA: MEDS domain-containing protein [Candidatus Limnocylindria bacterium]|nr:MEDS domain-containing protein [Candidatus Limnocylindria bacterium]
MKAPLGFGDRTIPVPSHVCLFYYDDTELRSRFGFLKIGLEAPDEAVVLFGRAERLDQVKAYLASDLGRDLAADHDSGKLVFVGGDRDPDVLLGGIGSALDRLAKRGTKLIRFMGFIGWGDPSWPSDIELLKFEAAVNGAAAKFPVIVVCAYNVVELPGPILMTGGVATHPYTVVGATLCENPHYVTTTDYLTRLEDVDSPRWFAGVTVGPLSTRAERATPRGDAAGRG